MPLHPPRHRLPHQLIAILTLTALLTLTACGPGEARPHATPTPSGTDASGFASDEEALAAAEAVYREYLEVSDGIAQAGGEGTELLRPLVTREQFDKEVDYFAGMRTKGTRLDGRVVLTSTTLQSASAAEVTIYGCLDLSAARYIDASGNDITAPSRPDRTLVEVVLDIDSDHLVIASMSPWSTSC